MASIFEAILAKVVKAAPKRAMTEEDPASDAAAAAKRPRTEEDPAPDAAEDAAGSGDEIPEAGEMTEQEVS